MEIKKFEAGREYYQKELLGCGYDEYALTIITKVLKRTAKTITVEIKTYGEYTYRGESAKEVAIEEARADVNAFVVRRNISLNHNLTKEVIYTTLSPRGCEFRLSCEESL